MNTRVSVIVNASSGSQQTGAFSADLAERFKSAGIEVEITMAAPSEMSANVRRAAMAKPHIIVIGGGDGTLSAAVPTFVDTETTLGILPLGTLNHFAKDLQIPLDLAGAVQTIASGKMAKVDVGAVNDRLFLNNSSLGLYPKVVADRDSMRQRLGRRKLPALIWAGLAVFRRYPFLSVRIDIDGDELIRHTPFVFVGNNRYEMEGFKIGERPRLDEAILSLYVANRTGRLGLIRLAMRALFKQLDQSKDFDIASAKSFKVETHNYRLQVANDGELCYMRSPLHYRVLPAALTVLVPKPVKAL